MKFLENEFKSHFEKSDDRSITMCLDKMYLKNSTIGLLSTFSTYVKFGWGLPLLFDEKFISDRIRVIKKHNSGVCNGGTLLEIASEYGKCKNIVEKLISIGFTHIELSEGINNLKKSDKKEVGEICKQKGIILVMEVGKKVKNNQLSLRETINSINEALTYEPDLIIIEGRESGKDVSIYDSEGNIKWTWVEEILDNFKVERLMFEAPMESQQIEFIKKLGKNVNLGNILPESLISLKSQRLGIRGDSLSIENTMGEFEASPATKFVYHVICNSIKADQNLIMRITGLKRRTVCNSINELIKLGMIKETLDQSDLRRKFYTVVKH
ncbi:phosphosulfolactate synthase [Caldiplasma sukawensis]